MASHAVCQHLVLVGGTVCIAKARRPGRIFVLRNKLQPGRFRSRCHVIMM